MLTALRISDFATLEEAELTLGPGLTMLTGETGAGKSLLVNALDLLLGGRADAEWVRHGAEEACVEGVFSTTDVLAKRLEALGLPQAGDELSVRRVFQRTGRGKVYVNGALVTVGVLAQLMRGMMDISGQLDSVSLFSPGEHRALLDRSGGMPGGIESERVRFGELYAHLQDLDARLAELGGDEAQVRSREDFLSFQLGELDELDPKPQEETALEIERRRLLDSDRLARAAQGTEALLQSQEGAALEQVLQALTLLREVRASDPAAATLAQRTESVAAELEDLARSVARYGRSIEAQPERLSQVEDRLALLRRLCRKHATDAAGLVQKRETLSQELERLKGREALRESLHAERTIAAEQTWAAAAVLTEARSRVAQKLAREVSQSLTALAMPSAQFEVQVQATGRLGAEGADEVQFLFSANAGEPVRPLAKVASGGEASRLLLALRRHLMASDDGFGCVLDEADAGVSGAVADGVGQLMKEVSRHRQVLCITHLPQVAAYGDVHFVVQKREVQGKTQSSVVALSNSEARSRELARMLSGRQVTQEALRAAEVLIRSAAGRRKNRTINRLAAAHALT